NLLKIVLITIMLFAIIKSLSLYWQVDSLMQQLIKVASIITLWLIIFIASGFVFKLEYWNSVTNSLCKKFLKK
nr:hypothetical protein [Candidatus Cloacimonadota bacterium]